MHPEVRDNPAHRRRVAMHPEVRDNLARVPMLPEVKGNLAHRRWVAMLPEVRGNLAHRRWVVPEAAVRRVSLVGLLVLLSTTHSAALGIAAAVRPRPKHHVQAAVIVPGPRVVPAASNMVALVPVLEVPDMVAGPVQVTVPANMVVQVEAASALEVPRSVRMSDASRQSKRSQPAQFQFRLRLWSKIWLSC